MADVVAPSADNPGPFDPPPPAVAPNNNLPEKPAWNGARDGYERPDVGLPHVSNGHAYAALPEPDRIMSADVDINGLVIDAHGEADTAPCEAFNPDSLPKEPRGRLPSPSAADHTSAPPQQRQPSSPSPAPASPRRSSPGPRKTTPTKIPSLRQRPKSVGSYEDAARRSVLDSASSASPRPSSCVVRSNSTSRKDPGSAKSPDNKQTMSGVKSRTVSHTNHKPGGGNVKIFDQKVDYSHVKARSDIGSAKTSPRKSGSSEPTSPRIKTAPPQLPNTKKVQSKIGSKDNMKHTPGGGKVKIQTEKVDFSTVSSRCGSLDNSKHRPGGGNVKILDEKVDFTSKVQSKVGSLDKASHTPAGGNVKIINEKLEFKADSKIGSKDNIKHQAGGGKVKITNEKVDFSARAASKIGSKDNMGHKPGGGNVRIVDEKLDFKESASPRTDTGTAREPKSPGTGSLTRSSRGSRSSVGSQEEVGSG